MTRDEALALLDQAVPVGTNGMTKLAERFNFALPVERLKTEDPAKFRLLLKAREVLEYEARLEAGGDAAFCFNDDDSGHARGTPQAEKAQAHWETVKARHKARHKARVA